MKFLIPLAVAALSSAAYASERTWTPEQLEVIEAIKSGPIGLEDDFEGWSSKYAEDWSYWRLGAEATRPRDEHMKLVRDYIEGGAKIVSYTSTPVDVIVRGDVALVRANMVEELIEADGSPRTVRFSSANMLAKEDGRWLMIASNLTYLPAEE